MPTALGSVLALALATGATATPPTPASGATWSQNQRVDYRWLDGSEPPSWIRPAIHGAARAATETSGASSARFSYRDGGPGWIAYTTDIPSSYAIGYAVRNVPHSYGIRLRPHGYALDWGTLRWCQFYDGTPPNGCYDAEMITLHEFGHVLTLGHVDENTVTNWEDTIMHVSPKTKAKAGWNAHDFGRCDVARLQLRYDAASPAERISTCLSIGTDLVLTASPGTSVSYGSGVAFTAVLRVTGAAYADKLGGSPLSGRTLWLQRRAIGATSWTDLVQMSAGAEEGRYSRSLAVYASYEYRARFYEPGKEGLQGSISGVVRLSVADPCVSALGIDSINAPTC